MKKSGNNQWFRRVLPFCLALLVLILWVFWDALFSGDTLFSMDGTPTAYRKGYQWEIFTSFWGFWEHESLGAGYLGRSCHPLKLFGLLFPPLVFHVLAFIVDTVLLCVASYFFLKRRNMLGVACWLPALAFGFSAYVFTLIGAGHRGMFHMMPYAVLLFLFIERAIVDGSIFHYALAGICAGFGIVGQPDVMLFFGLLASVYSLLLLIKAWRLRKSHWFRWGVRHIAGVLLALIFMAAVTLTTFYLVRHVTLPDRERMKEDTPQGRWEYATSWSMPPEEMLEFVAPCVYGVETGDRDGPYWGRVGRAFGWKPGGKGLMNLKQHSLYLGVIQLLFGIYAIVWAFGKVRGEKYGLSERDSGYLTQRAEIRFWSIAFIVCLLLALGRYTYIYRVFYSVPLFSKIRCPVKFIHLCEFSLCVLFGYGLWAFFADIGFCRSSSGNDKSSNGVTDRRLIRRRFLAFAIVAVVFAGTLFAGLIAAEWFRDRLVSYWSSLGLANNTVVMMQVMKDAFKHGGILFLIGAGVFGAAFALYRRRWLGAVLSTLLVTVVVCDLALVDRRFINVRDISVFRSSNSIVDHILSTGKLERVSDQLSSRSIFDPVWGVMRYNGVDVLEPSGAVLSLPPDSVKYFRALNRNVLRLWSLTNTRYVIGPTARLSGIMKHESMDVVKYFNILGGRMVESSLGTGRNVLLRFKYALPRALVYHSWRKVTSDEALSLVADSSWDLRRQVLVTGDSIQTGIGDGTTSVAEMVDYDWTRIDLKVDISREGVLLLNDRYDPDWRVRVDGVKAELLKCNYIMRGVYLSPGRHNITFTYRPNLVPFLASGGACIVLLLWAILRTIVMKKAQITQKREY
ncbi:MAG: YfhO family protein [Kiritimatiellae bacterium]|nr:YfhO family protein [Kiritimatiellia bacterium]